MKRILSTAVIASLAALYAPEARATNGMRMIGFGPVQNSMGGVSAAVPLDAATIVTNPAGMSALDTRLDLGVSAFMPTVKYTATWTPDGVNLFNADQKSGRPTDFIPTVGFVYKASDALTLGVAALGTAGMGVDYDAGASGLYGSKTLTSFMNLRLAPAASYKIMKGLSVGVALNLQYALLKYDVASALGLQPRDTKGAFGYGASIGVMYQPVDAVTLGLAYETKGFFQDFEWTFGGLKEKLDFDQPQVLTFGVAVRPADGLLVAADVEWINWSATNGKNQPAFDTNPALTGALPFNMNWDDQVVLKLGGQYAVTKEFRVRLGYNYGKSPLDPNRAFEDIAFPAIAEHHITGGVGYDFGKLTVNAGAMYSPESKLTASNPLQQGIVTAEVKMSQLEFDLGVAYRF
jgi:long-chain fatty acid transport protein